MGAHPGTLPSDRGGESPEYYSSTGKALSCHAPITLRAAARYLCFESAYCQPQMLRQPEKLAKAMLVVLHYIIRSSQKRLALELAL